MVGKKNKRVGREIKKMEKALKEDTKLPRKGPTPEDIFRQVTGKDVIDRIPESSENDFDEIPYKEEVIEELNKKKMASSKGPEKSKYYDKSSTEVESEESIEEPLPKGKKGKKFKKEPKLSSSDIDSDDFISKKYKKNLRQFENNDDSIQAKGKKGKEEQISSEVESKTKIKKDSKGKPQATKPKTKVQEESLTDQFTGNRVWSKEIYSEEEYEKKTTPKKDYGTAEDLLKKRILQRNSGNFDKTQQKGDEEGSHETEYETVEVEETDDEDDPIAKFVNEEDSFRFVYKSDWGGEPPKFTKPLEHPIKIIRLTYTGTDKCYDLEVCAPMLCQLQNKARKVMNLPDIQWNFMISSDGTVYEGRGWNVEGYKNKDCRRKYGSASVLELGFIGNFKDEYPNPEMTLAHTMFIRNAMKKGYVEKMHTTTPMFAQ